MSCRVCNLFLSTIIIGANFYYLPLTFQIIESGGGPFGFGLFIIPFTGCINILIIPALLSIIKYPNTNFLTILNTFGVVGIGLLSYLIYSIPEAKSSSTQSSISTSTGEMSMVEHVKLDSLQTGAKLPTQEELSEKDCVFNNDIKALSIEAMMKFDSSSTYKWNEENRELTTIYGSDTIFISIGGCYHFNFIAGMRTNNSNFDDTTFWFGKAKWLASTFFWNSIGQDYMDAINKGLLIKRDQNPINEIHYDFPLDTTLTNIFKTGVTINRTSRGTTLEIGAYVN